MGNTVFELPDGMTPAKMQAILDAAKKAGTPHKSEDAVIFADFEVAGGRIRVYKDVYRGRDILSVRRFYQDKATDEWLPGKGVTFGEEDIDEIITGLEKMNEWLTSQTRGPSGGSDEV
jgi:hypothetical protein